MAGFVFRDVGLSLFVAGAAFGEILGDSQSAKCCVFSYKNARCSTQIKLGSCRGNMGSNN